MLCSSFRILQNLFGNIGTQGIFIDKILRWIYFQCSAFLFPFGSEVIFFFLYKVHAGQCSWLVANICLWARSWAPQFFLEPSSALQFPLYTVILLFWQTKKYIKCLQFAAICIGWRLFITTLTMSSVIYERRLVVQNNILWWDTNNIAQKQHMHFCTL